MPVAKGELGYPDSDVFPLSSLLILQLEIQRTGEI